MCMRMQQQFVHGVLHRSPRLATQWFGEPPPLVAIRLVATGSTMKEGSQPAGRSLIRSRMSPSCRPMRARSHVLRTVLDVKMVLYSRRALPRRWPFRSHLLVCEKGRGVSSPVESCFWCHSLVNLVGHVRCRTGFGFPVPTGPLGATWGHIDLGGPRWAWSAGRFPDPAHIRRQL